MTLTERTISFLTEGLGMRELPSKYKYRKFEKKTVNIDADMPTSYYWVGKAGAVRAGKTSSDSISLTDKVHANMNLWERGRK